MKHTEEIKIRFTYDNVNLESVNSKVSQLIDVFVENELVFVEKTNLNRGLIKTSSGIAGAANLLHGLLLGHRDARYYNDEVLLRPEIKNLKEQIEKVLIQALDGAKNQL